MEPLKERDPRQAGPYTLTHRLGSGAMGQVFLARTPDHGTAAVKIVHESLAADPSFRRRFRREIEAARRVSGPRTAAVLDADPEAELPWMAVEYVEGPNVGQQVAARGTLPPAHVFWLANGIAAALTEIHGAGVIHRDLKPSNVLLSPVGPRVIDFGIARSADASAITTTGLVTGSPAFMSPEQAVSGTVTEASDVFCLGSVLFFAATGHPVFGAGPPAAMLYRAVHNDPDLSEIADPELRALIAACLRRDPAARPTVASISAYANQPPGSRDPRSLAAAPATQQLERAHVPPTAAGSALSAPTHVSERAAPSAGPAAPRGRRSALTWVILAAVAVLILIGGAFIALGTLNRNDPVITTGRASTAAPTAPTPAESSATSTTTTTATTTPTGTEPEQSTPASTAGTPTYLYTLTTGAFAGLTGTQRSYEGNGAESQNSTSFRVGCEGSAWPTTFRTVPGARRLTGTLLLDPETTPPDLVVEVDLVAGGDRIGHWRLRVGDSQKINKNVKTASSLELDALAVGGTCGDAAIGYGVIVDGALS